MTKKEEITTRKVTHMRPKGFAEGYFKSESVDSLEDVLPDLWVIDKEIKEIPSGMKYSVDPGMVIGFYLGFPAGSSHGWQRLSFPRGGEVTGPAFITEPEFCKDEEFIRSEKKDRGFEGLKSCLIGMALALPFPLICGFALSDHFENPDFFMFISLFSLVLAAVLLPVSYIMDYRKDVDLDLKLSNQWKSAPE